GEQRASQAAKGAHTASSAAMQVAATAKLPPRAPQPASPGRSCSRPTVPERGSRAARCSDPAARLGVLPLLAAVQLRSRRTLNLAPVCRAFERCTARDAAEGGQENVVRAHDTGSTIERFDCAFSIANVSDACDT